CASLHKEFDGNSLIKDTKCFSSNNKPSDHTCLPSNDRSCRPLVCWNRAQGRDISKRAVLLQCSLDEVCWNFMHEKLLPLLIVIIHLYQYTRAEKQSDALPDFHRETGNPVASDCPGSHDALWQRQ